MTHWTDYLNGENEEIDCEKGDGSGLPLDAWIVAVYDGKPYRVAARDFDVDRDGFIISQPENPWSLDRGMNGVSFRKRTFLPKTILTVKCMI